MNICDNCKGDGIVGVGENPHLKEGPQSTCPVCTGTGKVASVETPIEPTGNTEGPATNPEVEPKQDVETA